MIVIAHIVRATFMVSIIVHVVQTETDLKNGPQNYIMGFLAPWNAAFEDFSALTSASAISIAVEAVNADPTLKDNINLT